MKRWVIWCTTIITIICAAYVSWYHFNGPSSVTTLDKTQNIGKRGASCSANVEHAVKTAVAEAGSLPIQRNAVGTVVAIASTAVNSPQAGNVSVLNVRDGAIIKKAI